MCRLTTTAVALRGVPMFRIEFTPEAVDDLRSLRKYDQQAVLSAIEDQLPHQAARNAQPKTASAQPARRMGIRAGEFRVFYDIDVENMMVKIEAVGYKQGGKLFVHGQEYDL